jgi:rubrerythrin
MGASIDSKISKLTEESKRHLQSFEDKLEENTNKRLKRIEDLIASLANKPFESKSKNNRGATYGAPAKKSRGTDNHKIQTATRSWNRGGQASGRGRGRGRGRSQTSARAVTFDMSRTPTTDTLNRYSPQQHQQQTRTNQDVITVDNEPDSSADGWGRRINTSNNIPPSNINDGSGR